MFIDSAGCVHKTSPHTGDIFVKDEVVKFNLETDNLLMGEIIRESNKGRVFATKNCVNYSAELFSVSGLKLPDNSSIIEILNSDGEVIEIQCELSEGNFVVGRVFGNKIESTTKISITCTCTGSGGCKPFAAGGKVGCFTEKCQECIGKTSNLQSNESFEFFFIQKGARVPESDLAYFSDARMIFTYDEWESFPFVTEIEINSPKFQDALGVILNEVNKFEKIDLVATPILIFGKKLLITIPYAAIESGGLYTSTINGDNYSCSGKCGTDTKCFVDTANFGQVVFCSGCSSGCTLKKY
jgi:hypothetical protein